MYNDSRNNNNSFISVLSYLAIQLMGTLVRNENK